MIVEGVPSDSLNYIRSILVKSLSSENVGKNDVLKVKKFKSQKFEKLPKKVDVRDVRNRDLHRQQVIERKKTIEKAEQDRYLAIIKRNEERENRITEVRRPQRTSNSFAFGSSTPRNLDAFDVKSSYWGQRRAASTLNITYTLSPTESTLGAGFLGRKKTDLLPTIPKDKNYQGRNNNSLSNEQISCKIRNKQHLSSIKEMSPPKVPNLQKQSSVSMSHLVIKESPAHLPMSQNNLKTFKKDNQLTVGTSSKKSIQGSTSRPSSSLSTSSSTKINYRNNKPKIRRPRPSSIAGTGISNNINLSTTTTTSNIIVSATSPLTTSTISVTTPTNNLTQIKRTDNNNKPPIKKSIYNKKNKIKNEKLNDNTDDVVLLPTEIKINGDLNDTFTISDSLVSSIVDDETISISDNNMSSNNDMNKSKIHVINTQEEAIAALAERRRLAREEAERERLRLEEEEKAALQKQKEEEEQLQLLLKQQRLAEEERLEEAIRETKKKEEEDRLRKEEEQRLKQLKEEAERKAKLEAERQKNELLEKLQKEEKEREERRKRVEAIMLRTRGKNANSQSDEKTNDKNGNIGENIISDNKVKKEIEINSNSWKTTQALGNFVYNINSNNNDS